MSVVIPFLQLHQTFFGNVRVEVSCHILDTISESPEFIKLKEQIPKGDTFVIWTVNRLARSLKDLIKSVTYLPKQVLL